ncbi:hypothetical protein A8C32_13185 [Flavivirga aquatica]|uniref:Alpha-galactosidase n=2 Tax=Flavivirga aquatica TaxID=1849968 RepID=A0A1E5TE73_9FLAO|nr:hypothetical protein A8C32_13185 [Flavivirga aquatica]
MKYINNVICLFLFLNVSCQNSIKNSVLENSLVKVDFNGFTGNYSVYDKRDGSLVISNASFSVNENVSTDGYQFTFSKNKVNDIIGKGEMLVIKGAKKGASSLILELSLFKDKTFLVLNQGIENNEDSALVVKKFTPINGVAFSNFSFENYKTLDGDNGQKLTQVTSGKSLKSSNNILVTFGKKGARKHALVFGGLTYNEFQKFAEVDKLDKYLNIKLKASDPVGKLVDAHTSYVFKDKFYLDFATDNRFEALDKYGKTLKIANHVDLRGIDYPVLNFWYCYKDFFGNGKFRNNSLGVIEELEEIKKTGFLKYGPIALRLEPDDYANPNNQQGWWDDKHWQMYKGGQLLKPLETIKKWGEKVQELGGIPYFYCQTARRSNDYCTTYPEHTLFNNPLAKRSNGGGFGKNKKGFWSYDFTDKGFISHMNDVYANLKSGGLKGIKFDYPFTGWAYDGGFEDKYATTTSAYRNIYRLAYEGLGNGSDVQERIPPFGDVTLGLSTTQRTEGDCDWVYPGRITKTGLRWYKNRVVTNYDHDPINPYHIYPANTDRGWQTAITMTYLTSGRLEVGKYLEEMTDKMRYDLSRAVPLFTEEKSPRPLDAFSGGMYPSIYDLELTPSWHILTFYNHKIEKQKWPKNSYHYGHIAKDPNKKQFEPNKLLPNTVSVLLSDKTDDGGLGLDASKKYHIYDFWNWKYLGNHDANSKFSQILEPGEARIMAVHEVKNRPQFLSTNRHLLQGYLDMEKQPSWRENNKTLSGASKLIGGEDYKIIIASNGFNLKMIDIKNATYKINKKETLSELLYEVVLHSKVNNTISWHAVFE